MPHQHQRARAAALLDQQGLDAALFTAPATVTWLTGFAPPLQVGPNPFMGHPAYVWYGDGRFTCLLQDTHAGAQASLAADPDVTVIPYVGYRLDGPIAVAASVRAALTEALQAAPPTAAAGIERDHAPVPLADLVDRAARTVTAVDGWLDPLRAVKTDEELAKLRRAFALADVGHAAARQAATVGAREIDVWTDVHAAVERHAGRRIALGNDCVVGYRDANIGGWPETYALRDGDSLVVDLSARFDGYWSDSCATYVAGTPTVRQREIHGVVAGALAHAISLVGPGARASDVDREVRAFIEDAGWPVYPHHTGHGVGTTVHEAPRLAPYDDTPLEAGMVILLEPGVYLPGETGVRLEDAVLVTDDGAEVLTHHDKSLDGGDSAPSRGRENR